MFLKPRWYRMLPNHLKVPVEKLDDLEILRQELGLPHEAFMMGITISRWAVIRVQEETRERLRRLCPQASEKELWMYVIASRFETILKTLGPLAPDTISQKFASLDEIMKDIHSWDDALQFVFDLNSELGESLDDPSGIQDEINRVLEGQVSLTLLKAKIK